ncbi:hypothetical protein IWW38_002215 [Coemansia aciculifera]|uniref:Uncharacterized protein n=1 Tax=Coemansia aciculifera TaxID=417176 RepID=A0ACC1M564_9FUNG|nr:hypothetical protein IWW38_002215 [Coemansia aciculifera]
MRSFIALPAALSCILALCNAANISISNKTEYKIYNTGDSKCFAVDNMFQGNTNQVIVFDSFPVMFYGNADCSNLVSMNYKGGWTDVNRPIRSFQVIRPDKQ